MLPVVDWICKSVRGNRFEIFIDNFNGIHIVLGIENAVHIAGDCVTQNFKFFHRYGLMAVVEENLKCHRCLRHDGVARLVDCFWEIPEVLCCLRVPHFFTPLFWDLGRMGCHASRLWAFVWCSSLVWVVWMLEPSSIQNHHVPWVWWSSKFFDRAGAAGVSLHPQLGLSAVNVIKIC